MFWQIRRVSAARQVLIEESVLPLPKHPLSVSAGPCARYAQMGHASDGQQAARAPAIPIIGVILPLPPQPRVRMDRGCDGHV